MGKPKKDEKFDKDLCRIVTPEFRLSFPHLFKPSGMPGAEKLKFSVQMLFSKKYDLIGHCPKTKKPRSIKEAIRNAKLAEFGPKENWPKGLISCVRDGDVPDKKGNIPEGFAGHYVIKATSREDKKPQVLDSEKNEIVDPSEIPPGCYARAVLFARVWTFGTDQGVQFILDGIQKSDRKYTTFGGRKSADEVFEPWSVEEADEDSDDDEDEEGGGF